MCKGLLQESTQCSLIIIKNILDVVNCINGMKAIIFDLDDTLYGEKEYIHSGYRKIADSFPQVKDCEVKLWKLFEDKKAVIDEFLIREDLFTAKNKETSLRIYRFQKPDIHLYPGVYDMLVQLGKSYKLGLITDGRPEGQNAKIDALGIRDLFDEIIITDELGGTEYRKPNANAYHIMSEKLGEKFNEMCYVGDNVSKDFIAPEKLGMRGIWFQNSDGLYCD